MKYILKKTFIKKLVTTGLVFCLGLPVMVYGAEQPVKSQDIVNAQGEKVGVFQCTADTSGWARQVQMDTLSKGDNGLKLPPVNYVWLKDGVVIQPKGHQFTADDNGLYEVVAMFPEDSGYLTEPITIKVNNIDSIAPEILRVDRSTDAWTKGPVVLTFTCEDKHPVPEEIVPPTPDSGQPETGAETQGLNSGETSVTPESGETSGGSTSESSEPEWGSDGKGSGLHTGGAYSYDGGVTWTKDASVNISVNGNVNFVVRDAVGNTTEQVYSVENIDGIIPKVTITASNNGILQEGMQVLLTAEASDAESGLPIRAFSWDGGVSWTDSKVFSAAQEGKYTVLVTDAVGNVGQASIDVKKVVKPDGGGVTPNPNPKPDNPNPPDGGSDGPGPVNPDGGSGNLDPVKPDGGSKPHVPTPPNNGGGSGGFPSNSTDNNLILPGSGSIDSGYFPPYPHNPNPQNKKPGVVDESKKEKETKKPKESKKETKAKDKETKRKESESEKIKTPIVNKPEKPHKKHEIPWLLIGGISLFLAIAGTVIGKLISMGKKDEIEPDEDMETVYDRVSREAAKNQTTMPEQQMDDLDILGAGAAASALIDDDDKEDISDEVPEEVVEEIPDLKEDMMDTTVEPVIIPTPLNIDTEEFSKETEASDVISDEIPEEVTEKIPEEPTEEETVYVPPIPPEDANKIILEGEHSRLIYDPETGEYRYEFK